MSKVGKDLEVFKSLRTTESNLNPTAMSTKKELANCFAKAAEHYLTKE